MKQKNNINNIEIKIMCLFFAFFAWLYIMSDLDPVDTRELLGVQVKIANMDEIKERNLVLQTGQNLKAKVKIKSRRSVISKKIRDGIELVATLDNPKIGVNSAKIQVVSDGNDIGYTITPSDIQVNLEENKVKSEKIDIKSIGKLAPNTSIDIVKLSKNVVYVSGAASLIDKLDKVEAEVDLANNSKDFSKISTLRFLDKNGQKIEGLNAVDEEVVITVKVKQEKSVPIEPQIIEDLSEYTPQNIILNPDTINIHGSPDVVSKISSIKTQSIKMSDIQKFGSKYVLLIIPNGVDTQAKTVKMTFNTNVQNAEKNNEDTVDNSTIDQAEKQPKEDTTKTKEEKKTSENVENNVKTNKYDFQYNANDLKIENKNVNSKHEVVLPDDIQVSFTSKEVVKKSDIKLYVEAGNIDDNNVLQIHYSSIKDIEGVKITPSNVKRKLIN